MHTLPTTLAIGMPGTFEWIIIGFIGLLLFGKRLPEVGKGVAKGIVEFKKGLAGIEDEVETAVEASRTKKSRAIEVGDEDEEPVKITKRPADTVPASRTSGTNIL